MTNTNESAVEDAIIVAETPATPKSLSLLKRLSSIEVPLEDKRFSTGIPGLDTCLAESEESPAGLPPGTSVLVSGMPGGGKSTLTTYVSAMNLGDGSDALVLHGEERAERVKARWNRLGLKGADPFLFPLRDVEGALEVIRDLQSITPRLVVVVDSVQSLTLNGKRRPEHQSEAAEMICGQVTSNGGLVILVNHVGKDGQTHAGAGDLPHNVDIHLHITLNAKKSERALEVRKNRCGRAGFVVPLHIGISSLTIGTPAPLTANGAMAGARNNLEKARDAAIALFLKGMFLTGYDYDDASNEAGFAINPGMWRAGLDLAVKSMTRDKYVMEEGKKPGTTRKGWKMVSKPPEETAGEKELVAAAAALAEVATEKDVTEAIKDGVPYTDLLELS